MTQTTHVSRPDSPELEQLCKRLSEMSASLDDELAWPDQQLKLCGDAGVYEWFLPPEMGGQGWSDVDIIKGYLALSAACLTTTFVITQRMGACRRLAVGESQVARDRFLPDLIAGRQFATVGISHLTTSRQHLAKPVMSAEMDEDGVLLDGFSPWVTGAPHAGLVVLGASMSDGRQVLVALPTDLPGVSAPQPTRLVGLSASQTGPLLCDGVRVSAELLLAGPVENVMQKGVGAKTGGLQTSTLAIGLAHAAVTFMEQEAVTRNGLAEPASALRNQWNVVRDDLLSAAAGTENCSVAELRTRANSLALRAAQSALGAAKGTGYVVGHPVGRWCREALFFLVWSCPQPVMAANLCELAGISE